MSETIYGSKYAETKDLGRTELAKLVRTDIKALVRDGALPKAKYSVTCESYAGGGSINIRFSEVDEPGFRLFNPERLRHDVEQPHEFTRLPIYSERAHEIMKTLGDVLAAYNYDGSDAMTDYFHVRFYGEAKPCWKTERLVRDAETTTLMLTCGECGAVHPGTEGCPSTPTTSAQEDYLRVLGVEP